MISKNKLITLLKIAACLIFAGRAYQYIAYGAPFRTLLWDQTLLKPVVEEVFNTEWHTYATSKTVDVWIENLTLLNGIILAFAAIACIFINVANKKYLKHIIYLGSFSLMILSALLMKAKFFHNAQFFEHAIQMATPLVLVYAINEKPNFSKISFVLKILIAVTFTCHGLYALGYYPVPGNFVDMTINSIGLNEDNSKIFLYTAGILDLILSVLIFVPKISRYALLYAFFWGTITAFARITGQFNTDLILFSLENSVYQTIYRIAHGLVPLLVYLLDYHYLKQKETVKSPLNYIL